MNLPSHLPPGALLGLALFVSGCGKNCSGDSANTSSNAPSTQPAPQPSPQPAQQPAPPPAGTALRAPADNPAWPGALAPTAEAALHSPPEGPPTQVDLDRDGTPDTYYPSSCRVARHLAAGWASVALGTLSQPENTACGAAMQVAGHWLVPITGHGHETDEGRSYSWQEAAIKAFPSNDHAMDVWSSRVEENRGNAAGDYHFEAFGADAVLVSAQMGDATPEGQTGPMFQVARWDAAGARFQTASCWQSARPASAPSGAALCTATIASSFHLRPTQTLAAQDSREFPAGTSVQVLGVGTLQRGEATLHCVRALDGEVGFAFVTAAEAQGCPTPLPPSS